MSTSRRVGALAAAGLLTASIVAATQWSAQADGLDGNLSAGAAGTSLNVRLVALQGDDSTDPSTPPVEETTPPSDPGDPGTDPGNPGDPGTDPGQPGDPGSDPGQPGGDLPSLPSLPPVVDQPSSTTTTDAPAGNGNGAEPTGGLGQGNAGADGNVEHGACGGLVCAGHSYQQVKAPAAPAAQPAAAPAPQSAADAVLAYTGANPGPMVALAAALLLGGALLLVFRTRLMSAYRRRH